MAAQVVSYRLMLIQDYDDIESMIELAMKHGSRPVHEVYVKTHALVSELEVEVNTCNYLVMENQTHSLMLHHQ